MEKGLWWCFRFSSAIDTITAISYDNREREEMSGISMKWRF